MLKWPRLYCFFWQAYRCKGKAGANTFILGKGEFKAKKIQAGRSASWDDKTTVNVRGLVIEWHELEGHSLQGQGWRVTCPLPEQIGDQEFTVNQEGRPKTGAHQDFKFNVQSFTEKGSAVFQNLKWVEIIFSHVLRLKIGVSAEGEAGSWLVLRGLAGASMGLALLAPI